MTARDAENTGFNRTETPSVWQELRTMLTIAAPLAAAYLAEIAMTVTDRLVVGRLGTDELAAVGLFGDLVFETLLFAMAIVSVVSVTASQFFGEGQPASAGNEIRQGLWLATLLSIPGTIFCLYLPDLIAFTGQDEKVISLGHQYASAVAWCFLPSMWFIVFRGYVSALARPKSVMVITVSAVFLNAVLTYGLVFGSGPLPALGVVGSGIATSLVCWIMFAALAFHVLRTPEFANILDISSILNLDFKVWREQFKLGLPVGGIALFEGGLFAVAAILMGTFGADVLAANQILFSLAATALVIAISLGEATAIRIAYNRGLGRPDLAHRSGITGLSLSAAVMLTASVIFITLPELLVSLFIDVSKPENAAVVSLAVTLFMIAAVFQISDGVQASAARALRGLKDTFVPMLIAGLGYWVFGVGSGYLFGFTLGYGPVGIWWGLALGLTVAAVLLTWRFLLLLNKLRQ